MTTACPTCRTTPTRPPIARADGGTPMLWCTPCRAYFPVATGVSTRPDLILPDGALGELSRRLHMMSGALPPPPGTRQQQRTITLAVQTRSINRLAPGTLAFSRAVEDLRGRVMREIHHLDPPLPQPIPSVRENAKPAPVFIHARMRFEKPARRDLGNYGTLVEKAVLDALVGPEWKGRPAKGQERIPANREVIYKGALYRGGHLADDSPEHVTFAFDFDPRLGEPALVLELVWDEPA